MGSRRDPGFGLILFLKDLLNEDTLSASGSSYTEAGPGPGRPEPEEAASRFRPQITGSQSVALDLVAVRGGLTGAGATVGIRPTSEAGQTGRFRSWNEPNCVMNWTAPSAGWGSSTTWSTAAFSMGGCVVTGTQLLLVTVHDDNAASVSDALTWSYDPRTGTWTQLYDWQTGSRSGIGEPVAMAYDEELGRLLLWTGAGAAGAPTQVAYQSVDGGSTWSIYADGYFDATVADNDAMRVAIGGPGQDWLAVAGDNVFASSDRGVHWDLVETFGSIASPTSGGIPLRTRTGFVIIFLGPVAGDLSCVLLPTARSTPSDATVVEIEGTTTMDARLAACVDADGIIYVYGVVSADKSKIRVYRSTDDGNTWSLYKFDATQGASTSTARFPLALAAGGQVHLVGNCPDGHADTDGVVSALSLGGWSNLEQGAGATDSYRDPLERVGWGEYTGSAATVEAGASYFPWDLPENCGWGHVGAATTRSFTGATPGFHQVCTNLQQDYYNDLLVSAQGSYMCGMACLVLGAATPGIGATVASPDSGIFIRPSLDDGVNRYAAHLDIGSDGFRVRDGTLTSRALDTSLSLIGVPIWVAWHLTQGALTVWYRLTINGPWIRLANNVTITAAATAVGHDLLEWGHNLSGTAGTATVDWRLVASAYEGDWRFASRETQDPNQGPESGPRGVFWGKPIPSAALAVYPVPDATSTSEEYGWISATGGPATLFEQVSLPVAYRYPLSAIYPHLSPSPRKTWRTTDTSLVHLEWDQGSGEQAWYGGALAICVRAGNFRTATLERDDGAGGWTNLGTLDKGWSSVNWTRTGNVVVPRVGTATISRYIAEGELVGGYLVMSHTPSGYVGRRIVRNSGGFWSTSGTLQQLRIEVEGLDGTEDANGGGEIVAPHGLCFVYPTTDPARRQIRLSIAASQVVPGDYYEAGIFAVGRVVGLGADPDWDWSDTTGFAVELTRAGDGTPSVRRAGPPRRTVSVAWSGGVVMQYLRLLSESPDYVAESSGTPIGSEEDAAYLADLLVHGLESGQLPGCLVKRIPTIAGTLTDPSLWIYGLCATPSLGVRSVQGTEGEDELVRVDALAFEEIR